MPIRVASLLILIALTSAASPACPPQSSEFSDRALGFSICLPTELTAAKKSDGSREFTGFSVPAHTNLESKRLTIVASDQDFPKAAKPFGSIVANGIRLGRTKFEEGSAGHLTLHIIYTWKRGNAAVQFDFEHYSANIENFDGAQRPREYDRGAQIKLTEQVMSTLRRIKQP